MFHFEWTNEQNEPLNIKIPGSHVEAIILESTHNGYTTYNGYKTRTSEAKTSCRGACYILKLFIFFIHRAAWGHTTSWHEYIFIQSSLWTLRTVLSSTTTNRIMQMQLCNKHSLSISLLHSWRCRSSVSADWHFSTSQTIFSKATFR